MGRIRAYGLGMSRAEAIAAFEALGYAFQLPAASPGLPRRPHAIGLSPDGARRIELIGPEEHVFKAVFIADPEGDDREAAAQVLRLIAPDWDDGPDWFARQIAHRAHTGGVEAALPGLEIWLRAMTGRGQLVLTLSWVPRSDPTPVAVAGS